MKLWDELLEEILDLQLVDKAILDSYNQFAFTVNVTTEVDPLIFTEDAATPQEVSLILSYVFRNNVVSFSEPVLTCTV